MSKLEIITLAVGPLETNCYILSAGDECAVIDPGFEEERILAKAKEKGLKIKAILLTHGHFDHFFAAADIIKETGAKLIAPAGDVGLIADHGIGGLFIQKELLPRYSVKPDVLAKDGDVFTIAGIKFKYMHTPGHTPGSSVIFTENVMFSGDTILYHGPGRTDLEDGSEVAIRRSYRQRLVPLPDDMLVYPGHGDISSIAKERQNNPYFKLP